MRCTAGGRQVRAGALALAVVALLPGLAAARRPTTAELAEDGLTDPRGRQPPPRHRLRLAIMADYIKPSAAQDKQGKVQRFHYAPLLLDIAYQVQFLKYVMVRPSLAVGGNVANTKQAMPAALQPGIFAGYQGSILGVALGYSHLWAFPATIGIDDGHFGLVQPVLLKNHLLQAEVSITTRVDRGALNFAIRYGGVKTHLVHLNIDETRWKGVLTLSAGWFFELGKRRRSRQRQPPAPEVARTPIVPRPL
ncbi:MAG: hypothetical protein JNL82_04235 [Myxococcales bacterium]|nr:hypothetical protein [Myxococcales bacterium]